MIISASYRSDIPAFHAKWFETVLAAGNVTVTNPYGGGSSRIDLSPMAVDGYVFWTRNARPFARAVDLVRDQARPVVLQFTILGYPRCLDPNVPASEDAVGQVMALANKLGSKSLVWRYDPIILTPETELAWHRENFARLARHLCGASDEVIVSFAHIYAKSARNLKRAGIEWRVPALEEAAELAQNLAVIAAEFGFRLTLCSQPELGKATGLASAKCIDGERLSDVAGRMVAAFKPPRPNRPGCLCHAARDIGAYDTCAHGCRYCYAVADHERAAKRLKMAAARS